MFKFLHAADLHIDSPLKGLERYEGAPVDEFRGATRRALENLVELAIAESVEFVLIAGDLCDGDWRDYGTGLFLNAQFAKLRDHGIPVVTIRGNHDAANHMVRQLKPPENVIELSHEFPESRELKDCNVVIHGRGYKDRAERDNMAAVYPSSWGGYYNIGLLHTSATGRDGHEPYAPCSLEDMRSREYDYWALGHVHTREELSAAPLIVFPGNTQGRHIRETGPKGCTLVTVDSSNRATAEFRPLDVLRWEHCRVDLRNARDPDDALVAASATIRETLDRRDGLPLAIRVELLGACAAHDKLAACQEGLAAEMRDLVRNLSDGIAWVEKVRLRTKPLRVRENDDGPIGELVAYLEELRDDAALRAELGGELLKLAQALPAVLSEGDDRLDLHSADRVAELLDDVGSMILEQLG
jgi:DNA repair exonuclease SbcCD nuclease subunit